MNIDEVIRVINRHMARLLHNMEEAGCPALFMQAVKSAFVWLKSDLNEEFGGGNRQPRE